MRSAWQHLCLWITALASLPAQEPSPALRLRAVEITRDDVFAPGEAEGNFFFGIANALHAVTREQVVAREVWLRPGDPITAADADELERNLRRLELFGDATARLRPAGNGEVDLLVATRDRFSLSASGSVSRTGGVNKVIFGVADTNLLGTGKELSFDSSDAENRYTRSLTYWDPQLLDSWQQLFVRAGTTEVGPFADLQLHRPFKTLADPFSYGVDYSGAEEDVFYYRGGDTTASIGRRRQSLRLFAAGASGPRELRTAVGLDCRLSTVDYGAALGADAPLYRVPGDTTAVELGPYVSIDYRPRFDKVQRLDALDYTEDVALGANCTLRLAGRYRDEVGAAAQLEPLLDLSLRLALQPLTDTYLTLAAGGTVRIDGDRLEGWRGSVALHAYQLSLPAQTLAGSLTFDVAGDREDLQPQLTLGEDNGLRGYPAREFEGRRFARLNLEDRIDTGLDILSVHLGLAAFFDVGWVQDPLLGRSMQDGNRAFGAGLRFGSSHLLGSRVLRLDVAKPLDEAQGQHFGISVSFGSGQVFSFFGNAQALDSSF